MKRWYACVTNAVVMHVVGVDAFGHPPITDAHQCIDVTNTQPMPKEGWSYDQPSNTFHPMDESEIRLEQERVRVRQGIDRLAGEVRAIRVTDSIGQTDVYREKYDQAVDYITNPNETSNSFPLLLIECEIHNCTLEIAANRVIHARKLWLSIITSIERVRMKAKSDLCSSSNITEMSDIYTQCLHDLTNISRGR